MTDIVQVLKDQLATFTAEQKALQAQREAEQSVATKALIDAALTEFEAKIEKTRESQESVERTRLPGLEHAKNGEANKFSLFRAMCLAADAQRDSRAYDRKEYGLEVEAMRQIQERGGYAPTAQRAMNTGTSSVGGVFVPHQVLYESVIPSLQEMAVVNRAGAVQMNGLIGELSMIVDNGGTTATYIDTPSEETASESASTFSTIKLAPHTMSAYTRLTRDMRRQSAISMETYVQGEIARQFALREDLSALRGTGSDAQPRGLENVSGVTTATSFSGVTYTGGSQTLSDKLREMMYAPRLAKWMNPSPRWAWIADPAVGLKIAKAKDADGRALFLENNSGTLTTLMQTPFIESTLFDTASDSDAFLLYGDFTQLIMAHWGVMELDVVQQSTDALKGAVTIVAFMDHDIAVRQPKAFNFADAFTQ